MSRNKSLQDKDIWNTNTFFDVLNISIVFRMRSSVFYDAAYYANWLSIVYGLKDRLLKNLLVFFAENRRFNVFNLSLSSNEGKKRKMALFCSETSGSRR